MSIEEIVFRAQNGDKAALLEVMEKYKPFIIKTAMSTFISGKDIEDLIQEGYESIIKAVNNYNIEKNSSFTPYAMMAVKNNFFCDIRKNVKYNCNISMQTTIAEDITLEDTFEDDVDIEADYIHKEDIKRLRTALNCLLPEERVDILEYFNAEGISLTDIAAKKGINYSAMLRHKKKLIIKIKRLLKSIETGY